MTGALEVTWCVTHPDRRRTHESMRATTSAQVQELVAILSGPDVDDAYITHLARPTEAVPGFSDEPVSDHVMHAAVRELWGYLAYAGPVPGHPDGFVGQPAGDPASPGTRGTYNTDYPAGSGLPLDLFTTALTEFLTTSELPTGVHWTPGTHPTHGR